MDPHTVLHPRPRLGLQIGEQGGQLGAWREQRLPVEALEVEYFRQDGRDGDICPDPWPGAA